MKVPDAVGPCPYLALGWGSSEICLSFGPEGAPLWFDTEGFSGRIGGLPGVIDCNCWEEGPCERWREGLPPSSLSSLIPAATLITETGVISHYTHTQDVAPSTIQLPAASCSGFFLPRSLRSAPTPSIWFEAFRNLCSYLLTWYHFLCCFVCSFKWTFIFKVYLEGACFNTCV